MKVAVVYWSGTGNTEMMARAVLLGIEDAGGTGRSFEASQLDEKLFLEYDRIAFGCPSMGDEGLEKTEFEPAFERIEKLLLGKEIALFGSCGWDGGKWMEKWVKRCEDNGGQLVCDPVICFDYPDDSVLRECYCLGKGMVEITKRYCKVNRGVVE